MASGPHEREAVSDEKWNDTPLFMTELPKNYEDNPQLAALQALVHEGPPDERAENFKNQGNEHFREKRYREAASFYSQGVEAGPTSSVLLEALYCNRAACNLEFQNYGLVVKDCNEALKLNPKSSKALYRCAKALLKLDKLDDALKACQRCLEFDPSNTAVKDLSGEIQKTNDKRNQKQLEANRKVEEAKKELDLLKLACAARHLTFSKSSQPNEIRIVPQFDPSSPRPYTPTTQILFPIYLLYHQYKESDFISQFPEHSTFRDQLREVLPEDGRPPAWDVKGEYKWDNVSVYAVTRTQRLLKVGLKLTLAEIFLKAGVVKDGVQDGLEAKDGCLSFVVVAKGEAEEKYVEEFKKERGGD
ncbi:uncharacterized protein EI90DRAFT_3143980 [Cantharellus anzutake]|uniref:uncharacterized protein n=1 Tax=Cantharellus anzutake TaxID=1750568 RepID=UPI001907A799|nr:uncharacterized protein EI90DRAFT_3143980 [Cantharellus anzutake]KAF8339560.1 hypothetical protein EI90DRAFT_3143980 [Cantharellus anzutake]